MKQKDAEKAKSNFNQRSNKGRRKLEFSKQLPLSGKIIYLDVKDVRQIRSLEGKIKQLGGIIEKFLIKDVNYVISSNAPSSRPQKTEKGADTADSPAYRSTPSPFNMGQSPSPGAVENKKETVTRGKAILQIARHKTSHTNVIDTALKMNMKIVALDAAVKWIEKEILKIKPSVLPSTSKQAHKKRSGVKVQRLKTPFIKFEALNCHYRPIMHQLETWPRANGETQGGTCPFDGRALGRPQNSERGDRDEGGAGGNFQSPGTPQAQRDELSGTPQAAKSQSKTTKCEENSTCKLFGVPIVTAGEIKREKEKRRREAKRKGYCECCKEKYDNIDKHLRGQEHKNFVRNKKNFDALDRLIHQGPNTVMFLQKILLKHCVQQASRKPNSQEDYEEHVALVENTAQKSSPELAPEQRRVGRKVNRRHRDLKRHEQPGRVTIHVEKTNLTENGEISCSPSKQRSSSFPCVEKNGGVSTGAVVIRRSGSRGVYGSPRRSQSSCVRSEKTLVIRDSPIASLQPLRDFLNKHSTRRETEEAVNSADVTGISDDRIRKRKSCSQSPDTNKRQRRASELRTEVNVHSDGKSSQLKKALQSDEGCVLKIESQSEDNVVKIKDSSQEECSSDIIRGSRRSPRKISSNVEVAAYSSLSPRKSQRLSAVYSKNIDSDKSPYQQGSLSEVTDPTVSELSQRNHPVKGDSPFKKTHSLIDKVINYDSVQCELSKHSGEENLIGRKRQRSKSRQRKSDEVTNYSSDKTSLPQEVPTKHCEKDVDLKALKSPRRLASPKGTKLDKDRESCDMEIVEDNSVETNLEMKHKKRRKKWKKGHKSSPKALKGKKLDRLKLDESLCSDMSLPAVTPEKKRPELVNIHLSDSSSPTFKKIKADKIGKKKDELLPKLLMESPVFKRKSRKDGNSYLESLDRKEQLETTPRRSKISRDNKDDLVSPSETPKSGYSGSPKRSRRSLRNIETEFDNDSMDVLDKTLCADELRNGLQDMSALDDKLNTLSPSGSTRKNCSDTHSRQVSPGKSRSSSRKRTNSNVYLNEHCDVNLIDSPSKTRLKISEPGKEISVLRRSPRKSCTIVPENTLSVSHDQSSDKRKGKRRWRRCNSDTKSSRTVKLNRSWLILSERSMSKLLESEDDKEPFLGFSKEESDSQLPSDLTYEEVSEVDMSEDSTREWVIEEPEREASELDDTLDETLMAETSHVTHFLPSPDKASNSSWGEACDSFLKTSCEKRLKGQVCSTPLLLSKGRSPSRKKRTLKKIRSPEKIEKADNLNVLVDSHSTPRKSRKVLLHSRESESARKTRFSPIKFDKDNEIAVDKDIVFNFNYSPRRDRKPDSSKQNLYENRHKSSQEGSKGLRLLKKASDNKKTFTLSYGSKHPKSPKAKRRVEIDSCQTVIIVSPKSKQK